MQILQYGKWSVLLEKVKQQNKAGGIGEVKDRGEDGHGWPHPQDEFSTKVQRKLTLGYLGKTGSAGKPPNGSRMTD